MWLKQASGNAPTPSMNQIPSENVVVWPYQNQEELCAVTELFAALLPDIFVEVTSEGDSNDSIYQTALNELDYGCKVFAARTIERDRGPLVRWVEPLPNDPKFHGDGGRTFPLRPLTPEDSRYEWEQDYSMEFPESQPVFLNGMPKPVRVFSVRDFQDGSIDVLRIAITSSQENLAEQIRMWTPKLSRKGVILFHTPEAETSLRAEQGTFDQLLFRKPIVKFACPNGLVLMATGTAFPKSVRKLLKQLEKEKAQDHLSLEARPTRVRTGGRLFGLFARIGRMFKRKQNPLYQDLLEGATPTRPYVPQSLGNPALVSESKTESPVSVRS